jgi:hypothetical protein
MTRVLACLFLAAISLNPALAQELTKSPPGASVTILEPANGATVASPLTIKFGITGMDLAPAGTDKANSGHHHLLIDQTLADPKSAIPVDDHHKHFGKAQSEVTLELTPGPHTLQLVLGDKNHVPFDPPVQSEVITVTVK